MDTPTSQQVMQQIVNIVGVNEAVRLVSDAYNAEILANRMGRLEQSEGRFIKQTGPTPDLLQMALNRVLTVCRLTKA